MNIVSGRMWRVIGLTQTPSFCVTGFFMFAWAPVQNSLEISSMGRRHSLGQGFMPLAARP